MAELNGPSPPGDYPVVVVGSGPGGVQVAYWLERLGINHALISRDERVGGMFQSFPIFQRLISWSKPYSPSQRGTSAYQRFDLNSLIADEREHQALVPEGMDGSSYFPARAEMEAGIVTFAERTGVAVRFGCEWQATARDDDGFVLTTSDGEYRCRIVVFAVGMAAPWKPSISGIEYVPHYVETQEPKSYAGRSVFIIGKRNSAFEVADGLLPWARRIVLASPRPTHLSILTQSAGATRARYVQPYEDHVLGGGNLVVDATIERVERTSTGYRVYTKGTTQPGDAVYDADDVIAATGFEVPMKDLPKLGVATFYQGRLPAQSPYWESASVPGIYFAGTITQGSIGLKKYGIASSSGGVQGFRHNARVLARHIAERHFGFEFDPILIDGEKLPDLLMNEATFSPELWNQKAYLARVVALTDAGYVDLGVEPLAHFLDSDGVPAVAVTVETDTSGDIHPAIYVRRNGEIQEHLLSSSPTHDYRTAECRSQITSLTEALKSRR